MVGDCRMFVTTKQHINTNLLVVLIELRYAIVKYILYKGCVLSFMYTGLPLFFFCVKSYNK